MRVRVEGVGLGSEPGPQPEIQPRTPIPKKSETSNPNSRTAPNPALEAQIHPWTLKSSPQDSNPTLEAQPEAKEHVVGNYHGAPKTPHGSAKRCSPPKAARSAAPTAREALRADVLPRMLQAATRIEKARPGNVFAGSAALTRQRSKLIY